MTALFGTDGIRSLAGQYPLDKETIKKIGRCSANVLQEQFHTSRVVIGWDTRESGEWIAQTLTDSFCQSGLEVHIAGVFPTPGISFLAQKHEMIGVVVSASHNPYEYNGIKFFTPQGTKLNNEAEEMIEKQLSERDVLSNNAAVTRPKEFLKQAEKEYLIFLRKSFEGISSPRPFVIDCANGSTSFLAEKIFPEFFPQCHIINNKPSGKNINNQCGAIFAQEFANSLPDNTFGITFDGDGDRIILVDEDKTVRDGDYILGILATALREQHVLQNNYVIPTVMSNLGLLKYLKKENIQTALAPVGDKNVHDLMVEKSAILGGEQSGHIILRNYLETGDGMLTALLILSHLSRKKTTLRQLCALFDKYPQVLINLKTHEKPSLETVFPQDELDRMEKEIDGRILIRYSGTEPLLRIMVEGQEKRKIEETAQQLATSFENKVLHNV